MASSNVTSRRPSVHTHEGAKAVHNLTALDELKRSTLTALLFEDSFYEKGSDLAFRVGDLVTRCKPEDVAALAIEAREQMHLRHMPLFLVRELARSAKEKGTGALVRTTLARVIQRPDELAEYVSLYWKDRKAGTQRKGGKKAEKGKIGAASDFPLSTASRRGLADAFGKFNRYSLSKYRSDDKVVKLVDVLRLARPKPKDVEQAALWKELRQGTLKSEDTWEVELSAGKDKKATFERLLAENKLGGLAFLRNLRNMEKAGVGAALIKARFAGKFDRVLPFRFISAARHAKPWAADISDAMLRAVAGMDKLAGHTVVLVDISGSMDTAVSEKSEVTRMDAAAGMAVLCRELCEKATIYAFSDACVEVPSYRGLPLADKIVKATMNGGTMIGHAVQTANGVPYDRIIVLTDEQSHDTVAPPHVGAPAYMVNLATYKYGVGEANRWTHISGWSERLLDYVRAAEAAKQ